MKINALCCAIVFISPVCLAFSSGEKVKNADLTHVIANYRQSLASQPLDYSLVGKKRLPGVVLQKYRLYSQSWSPQGVVSPQRWQHDVDIYLPDKAKEKNALVVVNNGSNDEGSGHPVAPSDFSEETLSRIALATRTVVISVSNIPNQVLHYAGNPTPLAEDDSVAYSWKLFLHDPQRWQNVSLHIPMAAAVSQAMRLSKKELSRQHINKFIVSGASKRGWAAWLTALADPDVNAVVPFVMDLLQTKASLEHMYQSYGKNWPVAFYPYYQQGIDQQLDSDAFASLMTLEDPISYLNSDMADRLAITKYIVNASGDDFYVPDNSRFYYGQLPGAKSLRVVPNSTHHGVLSVAAASLITFVNRFQAQKSLPEITETIQRAADGKKVLTVRFSEKPAVILRWRADNPAARDFRYACGIKYSATSLRPAADGVVSIPLTTPDSGWRATYVEATFSDGYVATSQVYITPDKKYPDTAPPSADAACQTLPGRERFSSAKRR